MLVRVFGASGEEDVVAVPFLSSMVTVSFMHFIRNLRRSADRQPGCEKTSLRTEKVQLVVAGGAGVGSNAYLTSFILTYVS